MSYFPLLYRLEYKAVVDARGEHVHERCHITVCLREVVRVVVEVHVSEVVLAGNGRKVVLFARNLDVLVAHLV